MSLRKVKQLCERLFKLPAHQQALAARGPDGDPRSLGKDDESVLGSLNLQVWALPSSSRISRICTHPLSGICKKSGCSNSTTSSESASTTYCKSSILPTLVHASMQEM